MQTAAPPRPAFLQLFLAFAKIGLFSFGGGSTTLVLMDQEMVRHRAWLTTREFALTMGISRMYPGVHLLAQSVLIGHHLRGVPGGLLCLFGMMLPATLVTIAFTMGFVWLRANPVGAALIGGVLPATAGLSIAVAWRLAQGEMQGERLPLKLSVALIGVGSFVLMGLLDVSSIVAVLLSGVVGAVLFRLFGRPHESA